jgi:hypothetical protein
MSGEDFTIGMGERLLWPQPQFWDGLNDVEICCDQVNGHGLNPEMMPVNWTASSYSRATVMVGESNTGTDLPTEGGMEVDIWIRREQDTVMVRYDPNRAKAVVE